MKELTELHIEAKRTLARIETAQNCLKAMDSRGGGFGDNPYEGLMNIRFGELIDMLSPNNITISFDANMC